MLPFWAPPTLSEGALISTTGLLCWHLNSMIRTFWTIVGSGRGRAIAGTKDGAQKPKLALSYSDLTDTEEDMRAGPGRPRPFTPVSYTHLTLPTKA